MPDGPLFTLEGSDAGGPAGDLPGAVAAAKGAFPDSPPTSVVVCKPGKGKKAAPPAPCPADKIKKNLDACDGGTGAWDAAKKSLGKDPTVEVKKTKSGFDAETDGGTIRIAPTPNCCDATESLLFELHNVESSSKFTKIEADAAAGKLSREDYTRSNEHVEYDGLKRSWTVFDKCSKTWGCGPAAKSFADGFRKAKDFDDYYDHYLGKSHKDHYRKFWDKNYKAAYDKKHKKP